MANYVYLNDRHIMISAAMAGACDHYNAMQDFDPVTEYGYLIVHGTAGLDLFTRLTRNLGLDNLDRDFDTDDASFFLIRADNTLACVYSTVKLGIIDVCVKYIPLDMGLKFGFGSNRVATKVMTGIAAKKLPANLDTHKLIVSFLPCAKKAKLIYIDKVVAALSKRGYGLKPIPQTVRKTNEPLIKE